MTDKPIPFSSPMVMALLAGRKTQTRRMITPQPVSEHGVVNWSRRKSWFVCNQLDVVSELIAHNAASYSAGDRLWVQALSLAISRETQELQLLGLAYDFGAWLRCMMIESCA